MLLNVLLVILVIAGELFLLRFLAALWSDKSVIAPQWRFRVVEMPVRGAPSSCRRSGGLESSNDSEIEYEECASLPILSHGGMNRDSGGRPERDERQSTPRFRHKSESGLVVRCFSSTPRPHRG